MYSLKAIVQTDNAFKIYFKNLITNELYYKNIDFKTDYDTLDDNELYLNIVHLNYIFDMSIISLNQFKLDSYVTSYCTLENNYVSLDDISSYDMIELCYNTIDEYYKNKYLLVGYKLWNLQEFYEKLNKLCLTLGRENVTYDLILSILIKQNLTITNENTINAIKEFIIDFKNDRSKKEMIII